MRKTKEDTAKTRDMILDAALKIFSQKGYAASRLEDVAEEAGLTRGAIYWHFENKLKLYYALFKDFFTKKVKRFDEMLQSGQPPLTRIRRLMQEAFVHLEDDEDYRAIEMMNLFKTERTEELKNIFKECSKYINYMKDNIRKIIQEGIAAGEIGAKVDPETAALAMIIYIYGVKSAWMLDTKAFSPKKCADGLIDIFFNGIIRE